MPLIVTEMETRLNAKLTAAGFNLDHPNCVTKKLTRAIAEMMYEEITQNAVVNTTGSAAAQTGTIS